MVAKFSEKIVFVGWGPAVGGLIIALNRVLALCRCESCVESGSGGLIFVEELFFIGGSGYVVSKIFSEVVLGENVPKRVFLKKADVSVTGNLYFEVCCVWGRVLRL